MIIEKNKFEINGNTVLAPDESLKRRKYEDLEKSRKEIEKNKRIKNVEKKKGVLRNILFTFIIGLAVVGRYCMIYNYQNDIAKTKAQIEKVNKENEGLKVQLIKFKNISYIEEVSTKKLHMVKPSISDIYYCDLSKNNLEDKKSLENKTNNNILQKIKDIIF